MVNVLAYMGNEKWMAQSWWKDLYPGDDVVDWIGLDSYVSVEKGYYHYGDLATCSTAADRRRPRLVRLVGHATTRPSRSWSPSGACTTAPSRSPTRPPAFNTVVPELKAHPQIKAVVYFDTASDDEGDRDISVNSTASSLTAFRKVAADPMFNVSIGE